MNARRFDDDSDGPSLPPIANPHFMPSGRTAQYIPIAEVPPDVRRQSGAARPPVEAVT